jgi:hypothetical protein
LGIPGIRLAVIHARRRVQGTAPLHSQDRWGISPDPGRGCHQPHEFLEATQWQPENPTSATATDHGGGMAFAPIHAGGLGIGGPGICGLGL